MDIQIYFVAQIVPGWLLEALLQLGFCVLSTYLHCFLSTSLLLATVTLGSFCNFSAPGLKSTIFQRALIYLIGEWYLESKI